MASLIAVKQRKHRRQDQGKHDSAQTEPRKITFQALHLPFPVPHLVQDRPLVLFGLFKNLVRLLRLLVQKVPDLHQAHETFPQMVIERIHDDLAKVFRVGLGPGRERRLPRFRCGLDQPVHGPGLGIHAIRDTGENRAEKIEGFAQLVIREGRGRLLEKLGLSPGL